MKIKNTEILWEIGNRSFPPPFELVAFNAPDTSITSPLHRTLRVTIMETGLLAATIMEPSVLTPYQQIFDIINQLIGEDYYNDTFGRNTLKSHASNLRGKIAECLRRQPGYAQQPILQVEPSKGYTLLPKTS